MSSPHITANVKRFNDANFAALYDDVRPQPPQVIVDLLTQLARVEIPRVVVDLGSGTGLSTRIWAERAEQIVGVEPSADMRRQAEARNSSPYIRYVEGFGHQTGLPDACADIVTCSQSFHWMEPDTTLAEIARILRPGGVFGAYDVDWPPTVNAEAEIAYTDFDRSREAVGEVRGFYRDIKQWDKQSHLARMHASGRFRYTKEILLHSVEQGDAERLIKLAFSQAGITTLLKNGMSEEEIGVPEFRCAIEQALGDRAVPFWFSYRMRVGIK